MGGDLAECKTCGGDQPSDRESGTGESSTHPKVDGQDALHQVFKGVGEGKGLRVSVLHGNALEKAQKLAERIENEFNPVEMIINIIGPVLGINTGPGALALCGYLKEVRISSEERGEFILTRELKNNAVVLLESQKTMN